MKETIVKINKTIRWFNEKIKKKKDKPSARLIKKKERRTKSINLTMKNEMLQQPMQKHKGLSESGVTD